MLIKFLKTNQASTFSTFFGVAFLFLIIRIIVKPAILVQVYHPFLSSLVPENKILSYSLVFIIGLLVAMGWNNLLSDKNIFKTATILPAFTLILLSSAFEPSIVWLVYFLMLFAINKLMSTYSKTNPYDKLYDSALLVGLSTVIYPTAVWCIGLVVVASFIYSTPNWRNIMAPLLGFLTPFVFVWAYGFYTDSLDQLYLYYFSPIQFSTPNVEWSVKWILWFIVISVLFLVSLKEMLDWIAMKNLQSRRAFYIFFVYCVCVFIGLFFSPYGWNHLLLLCLPLSVLIANYFMFQEDKWWYDVAYLVLIIVSISLHLWPNH